MSWIGLVRAMTLAAVLALAPAACAQPPLPTGPSREALPPSGKGWEALHREDLECRAMAAENLGLGAAAGDALLAGLLERRLGAASDERPAPWAGMTPQQRYDAVHIGCHGTFANGF